MDLFSSRLGNTNAINGSLKRFPSNTDDMFGMTQDMMPSVSKRSRYLDIGTESGTDGMFNISTSLGVHATKGSQRINGTVTSNVYHEPKEIPYEIINNAFLFLVHGKENADAPKMQNPNYSGADADADAKARSYVLTYGYRALDEYPHADVFALPDLNVWLAKHGNDITNALELYNRIKFLGVQRNTMDRRRTVLSGPGATMSSAHSRTQCVSAVVIRGIAQARICHTGPLKSGHVADGDFFFLVIKKEKRNDTVSGNEYRVDHLAARTSTLENLEVRTVYAKDVDDEKKPAEIPADTKPVWTASIQVCKTLAFPAKELNSNNGKETGIAIPIGFSRQKVFNRSAKNVQFDAKQLALSELFEFVVDTRPNPVFHSNIWKRIVNNDETVSGEMDEYEFNEDDGNTGASIDDVGASMPPRAAVASSSSSSSTAIANNLAAESMIQAIGLGIGSAKKSSKSGKSVTATAATAVQH